MKVVTLSVNIYQIRYMERFLFLLIIICLQPWKSVAQTAKEEIFADISKSASNFYAYPEPSCVQTPPPAGYKPFYISHYARHGSRFLVDSLEYLAPLRTLEEAAHYDVLTELGKEVLVKLDSMASMARGRYGELTSLGARQHRGIAERMYNNFPEIFRGKGKINARSSIIVRCILSMTAECLQLQSLNPSLVFRNDASAHDMYFLSNSDEDFRELRNVNAINESLNDFRMRHLHSARLMQALFKNANYVKWKVDADKLMFQLFRVACNMQSHDFALDLFPVFTKEECYDLWQIENYEWYLKYGPSPVNKGKVPYVAADLLEDIIEMADSCINSRDGDVATLRFGHEVCVMPLACLMDLGNCSQKVDDGDSLANVWRNYQIFPMASNIQLVFYRNKKNDVLVKVLLNEREMSLPLSSNIAPYYLWKDVRDYYKGKIDKGGK